MESQDSLGTRVQLRAFELFTVICTIKFAWLWGSYMPRLSNIVLPAGLANYIDVSIFFGDLAILNAACITIFILTAFFFKKCRWLYITAFILLHLQYVARFSQGKLPHGANWVGYSLLGLGLAELFFKDIKKSLSFAFGFTLFFMGLGYTSAAISKIAASGFGWVDGRHLWLWIEEKSVDTLSATGAIELNWLQELALSNWEIATAILSLGLLTELFGFLIWWKHTRPFITVFLLGMHIGIDIAMNILFIAFIIQLFIMGFPWNRYINQLVHSSGPFLKTASFRKFLLF